ncbi:MAG: methionine gamma-lyase family protein [Defluviitaleaceae bacterium]|nr:methionine gamma-lyase family protein [Defluviitaleaceae bacterium]
MTTQSILLEKFGIKPEVFEFCNEVEIQAEKRFREVDEIAEYNQAKVLAACVQNELNEAHFAGTTGYGFDDIGRETLEKIYADTFNADVSMVRMQIISGTHALSTAMFGNLRHGDELVYATGQPYDTLHRVIGITPTKGSLIEHGVEYNQIELLENGSVDYDTLGKAITKKTKVVAIQRSKGYSFQTGFPIEEIKKMVEFIKGIRKDVLIMVDNCYGEFVERLEPTDVGADAIVGSLIKNPGGGIAPTGGYIVGTETFVENSARCLFSPSMGLAQGATLGQNKPMLMGFFLAPAMVGASVKTAIFMDEVFTRLGFKTSPPASVTRTDTPQVIRLGSTEKMIAFCRGIQKISPVDSHFAPEPCHLPGYADPLISAAGAFTQGSTIELSADGPIRPPYDIYVQGGLTWYHGKIGAMAALNEMYLDGLVKLPK